MSDLDTLMVAFQTQLSDVMETVMKTAMYEVSRLVEDGLLRTVKRRNKEVESLKIQLQWAERKLSDQEGKDEEKTGKCVNCAKGDVEQFDDTAEKRPKEHTDDIYRDDGVKEEGDCMEIWTSGRQEVTPETAQTAHSPTSSHSPESQATDDDVLSAVDVKKEQLNKRAGSSLLLVGWSGSLDSEVGAESHSATEMTEAQPKQTPENSKDLVRSTIKQDPQICTAYILHEEEEESPVATDPCLEVDGAWGGLTVSTAGLLQDHSHASEKDSDPARTSGSLQQTDHELTETDTARDSTSVGLPKTLGDGDALGVAIKQEVLEDSGGFVEMERKRKKTKKSGISSFSVKQYRLSSEQLRQNQQRAVSHKATAQEVLRLHSRVGAGLRLQTAIQQLHRPVRKPAHPLSNSTAVALSGAHSPNLNLNPLNRIPSTSKAAPLPHPPSVHRIHLGNRAATNRTYAPGVSIKTQLHSANSHHGNPLPHPDSHPQCDPKDHLRCGQCGRCFPHPSNLKAHLQTHTGERPFCCSLCGRSFTKLSNLKAHRRVHTGERPYCCLACGKCFTQKCNLKRHQRIHLDV